MKVLMVAEKPSIAIAIAKVLAKGQFSTSRGRGTPIHEWDGTFRGQRATFAMTSVLGHVYDLNFPPSLGWSVDPRTLFDAATVRNESNPEQHICQHLGQAAKGFNALVLWLDCDREGENIAFEVMENCEPKMAPKHEVFRARFSAITPQDVSKAMSNLVKPNKNEALSVDARREIDLKVGVAFTRYQTTTFHFRYANLDAHLISYGPCQTPTLGFVVDRYDEIQRFRPTAYFKLVAHILRNGVKTKLKWQRNRVMKDRTVCLGHLAKMNQQGAAWATVKDVKTSTSKLPRPVPLNTVALMKAASTLLGMGPQQCMHIAEHLYINGWISYPRTESSSYPEHFDIYEEIERHVKHPEWGSVAEKLLSTGLQRAKKGVDHGDHPPITPMASAHRDRDLTGSEWRLYEYITCHFIATVCPDATIENQTILYEIGGEDFASNGSSLKEAGFLEVMTWHRPADKYMASVKLAEQHQVDSVTIKEGTTKPPNFISESELITLMEKHGIGTDASIPTHIENIQRSYVKLHERTRTLEPNKLGIALVHGYHRIDPELVLPKVRANIENMVAKIALGQATYESVLKSSLELFTQKFDNFVASVARMDELFEASFSSLTEVQVNTRLKPKCGKCTRYMKYIDSKPHRLYCVNCEEVYSMPKDGSLKSDGAEALCPLDHFELVVHTDRKGKVSRLCPKCYNEPDFPGMQPAQTCAQCPNSSCQYSISKYKVEDSCPHCDVGFLAIEPQNGRRIDCNLCLYHIELPNDANKIFLSKDKCRKCKHNSTLVAFKYSEKNNPQPDKTNVEFVACIRCDPIMTSKIKVKIPGVREPRMGRHAKYSQAAPSSSDSKPGASPATTTAKPAETFYSQAAIAAVLGKKALHNNAASQQEEEEEIDYGPRGRRGRGKQQPQRIAPASSSASIMDFVVVHKTKKTGNAAQKPSAPAASAPEEEWEDFDPSKLEDVVLPDINPPSSNYSSAPSHGLRYGHQRHENQGGRNQHQGQAQQRDNRNQGSNASNSSQQQQRNDHNQRNQQGNGNQAKRAGNNKLQQQKAQNSSQQQDHQARPQQAPRQQPARQQSQPPKAKPSQAPADSTSSATAQSSSAPQSNQQAKPKQANQQNQRQQVPRSATSPAYVPKVAESSEAASSAPAQKQQPARAPKQSSAAPSTSNANAPAKPQGQQRGGTRNSPKSSTSKAPQYAPKAPQ